jgi:hypothetical protein
MTSRRALEDMFAYLITEGTEEAFYAAEYSGMFRDIARALGMGQSMVSVPVMRHWVQPSMWGLAQK